jgi:hypothetical protein
MDRIQCTACKVQLPREHFKVKRSGDVYKQCMKCNDVKNRSARKNKCPHNRQKTQCIDCGGSGLCCHSRPKHLCKDCEGAVGICEHNRVRTKCKDCHGTAVCIHHREAYFCIDCNGNGVCIHTHKAPQ